MAAQRIFLYPSQQLRTVSSDANLQLDPSLGQLFADLHDTAVKHEAAGLSAIQIGVPLRVVYISSRALAGKASTILVNPMIIGTTGDKKLMDEGCLSVPHVKAKMARHECVLVSFIDDQGVNREEKFKDMAAQCVEHELEHLDGKIFVDQFPGPMAGEIRTAMQNFWRQNYKTARKSYKMG